MHEFVEGWYLGHTLGEGAYGEVKLLISKDNNEAVAMKMIDSRKHPEAPKSIKKETTVHRILSHPNLIRYFGFRSEPNMEYIFLEYASGGELFDRIEPDVGMPYYQAQKYFRQLITAVEYMHSRGVAHRDLKPENLLLDENDNLKVTDFGMATVFRLNGKERILQKRCGTIPYVAPEVLTGSYHAEPADIWSCGIILTALLSGELPWNEASFVCQEYTDWREGRHMTITPWIKIEQSVVNFIRKILKHVPAMRLSINEIKEDPWFVKNLQRDISSTNQDNVDGSSIQRLHSDDAHLARQSLSQPELSGTSNNNPHFVNLENRTGFAFSQPVALENLLVLSQPVQNTPNSLNTFQKLVRRMTRFFVKTKCDETVAILGEVLTKLQYSYRFNDIGIITISTVDRRKMPLTFKAVIVEMDHKILVDFRLSKGCGIEFKRHFVRIKEALDDIIVKGPVTWPLAVATKTVP